MKELVAAAFDDLWLVARYVVVGLFAVFLNIALLYAFTDIMGFWYLASAILAFIITFAVAFMLQKHFTFRDGQGAYVRQGTMYFLVGVSNLLLDAVLLFVAVDLLHVWYLAAQTVIMGFLAFLSFLVNRHLTFRTA
jgi:dolichol-phosphate mannosyltransferase